MDDDDVPMVPDTEVEDLRRQVTDCDVQIRHWKDRADTAEGFGRAGTRRLTPQKARHHQQVYEEKKLVLIEQLHALSFEYEGPPTTNYQFDVTEVNSYGFIKVYATLSNPRCVHEVRATSQVEGRTEAVRDHKERCMRDAGKKT